MHFASEICVVHIFTMSSDRPLVLNGQNWYHHERIDNHDVQYIRLKGDEMSLEYPHLALWMKQ